MERKWWKEAVVYQVYPRSFMDSDGDGIGDLKGIISRLDYIKSIGVDVIWLSPIYKSPNADNGYDISDYKDIMSDFGTMADFDELLAAAHAKGMKLIMDLVVNHTSDKHQWFIESKSSKDNEKRDYYIWRDEEGIRETKDMVSLFSSGIWDFDENTEEYYLHLFSKNQVDLNWKNPKVREEIFSMIIWWLDKGVDGFRMDAITLIAKDEDFLSGKAPASGKKGSFMSLIDQQGVHEILHQMNKQVLSRYDVMTVGEAFGVKVDAAPDYISDKREELNMIFNFELAFFGMPMSGIEDKPWKVTDYKGIVSKWQLGLQGKGWNSLFLCNHDIPRHLSQYGNDGEYREQCAKMFATMMLTLQGTPFIYQGEEIGMTNVRFDSIEDYRDIVSLNLYEQLKGQLGEQEAMKIVHKRSRDNARTPMQWNSSENAGFTSGNSWIKTNPNYKQINVEAEEMNGDSVLNYYRKLISLRKENDVLVYGNYKPVLPDDEEIFSYIRQLEDERILVVMNFSEKSSCFELPKSVDAENGQLLISNYKVDENEGFSEMNLKPYEARVYRV